MSGSHTDPKARLIPYWEHRGLNSYQYYVGGSVPYYIYDLTYQNLLFWWVLLVNPTMEFIGTYKTVGSRRLR